MTNLNEGLYGFPTKNVIILVITLTGRRATPKLYKCTLKRQTYVLQGKKHFNWLACIFLSIVSDRPNSENIPDFAGYPRACKPMQGPKNNTKNT